MGKKYKIAAGVVVAIGAFLAMVFYLRSVNVELLNPKGIIADKQFNLIVFAALLSLFVIVPVYVLLFTFLHKYRETNTKAVYEPNWDHNRTYEIIWWGLPILLIAILSVVTWNSSHELDPYKKLDSNKKPLNVQVVALQWKWLFIYPEQNIATINYLQIPVDTPVNFTITADAPMNSFWIPQLGGQIYAMSGMSTKLHLMANEPGVYNGYSANISGVGFAGMKFAVDAVPADTFDSWARNAQDNPHLLDSVTYASLAEPSENNQMTTYYPVQSGLYDTILAKYMLHTPKHTHDSGEEHCLVEATACL